MRMALIAAMLIWPMTGMAQYKCVIEGRTTYAERPCTPNSKPMDLKVVPVTDEERKDALVRQMRAASDAQNFADRSAAEQADIDLRTRQVRGERAAAQERCRRLLAEAKSAENDSRLYRYNSVIVEDALQRKKAAEASHFSDCYSRPQ